MKTALKVWLKIMIKLNLHGSTAVGYFFLYRCLSLSFSFIFWDRARQTNKIKALFFISPKTHVCSASRLKQYLFVVWCTSEPRWLRLLLRPFCCKQLPAAAVKKYDMRAVREVQVIKLKFEEAQLSNAQKTFDVYMPVHRHKRSFSHYLCWNARICAHI